MLYVQIMSSHPPHPGHGFFLMDCVFCTRINNNDCEFFNSQVAYFEPLNPVTPGHLLVVPVKHVVDFSQDPFEAMHVAYVASSLMARNKHDQFNVISSVGPDATQTIMHFYVHIVPRRLNDGLMLPWTGQKK